MLKKILKWTYWIIIAILIIPASKYYYTLARDYIAPPPEKTYAKGFIFTVKSEFSSFFSVANDIDRDSYNLREKNPSEKEREKLLARIDELKKKLEERSSALDAKLIAVLQRYPDAQLKVLINDFMAWKEKNKYVSYPYDKNNAWLKSYFESEREIYSRLRELSGIYNIEESKDAFIMSILPEAIDRLKANPDDRKLCSVMSDYNERSSIKDPPIKIAQRIAFVEYGKEFCPKYYRKRSSWGILGEKDTLDLEGKNYVPYAEYYKTKVVPMMPKALTALETDSKEIGAHIDVFCDKLQFRGLMHERDPFRDAMVAVAKQKRPDLCANKSGIENRNIDRTSYHCLESALAMCTEPNYCDAVEVCKPFAEPLFVE